MSLFSSNGDPRSEANQRAIDPRRIGERLVLRRPRDRYVLRRDQSHSLRMAQHQSQVNKCPINAAAHGITDTTEKIQHRLGKKVQNIPQKYISILGVEWKKSNFFRPPFISERTRIVKRTCVHSF